MQRGGFMDIKETFANKLRELRVIEKLSQTELAEKLGVSRGSISFYENGERTADIDFIYKAAQFFNVSADYLIGRTNASTQNEDIRAICGLYRTERKGGFGASQQQRTYKRL